MAYSFLLRRTASSSALFNRLFNTTRAAAPAPLGRCYNTNSQLTNLDEDDRGVDTDRRSDRSVSTRRDSFFPDVFDPFSPPRSLSQMLNLMDQFMDNPFLAASSGMGLGGGYRRGWDVREDDDALCIKMDMPGVDKENVKVSVDQNTLIIKGERERESEDEEYGRRYSSRLDLPPDVYKFDQIKAEMKNGVLKVHVPKVKKEERKDAFQVNVE